MSTSLAYSLCVESASVWRTLALPRAAIERIAMRRLRELLAHASQTAFYGERLRKAGISPGTSWSDADVLTALRAQPAVTKQDLLDAGEAVLGGGRVDPSWYSSHSSGSTGEPFRVYYDARAWAILKYLVKLRGRWAGGMRPHHRIALLDATPPERDGRTALERGGRVRRISVLQPAERVMAALSSYRPDIIYGLPSTLVEAAMSSPSGTRSWSPLRIFTSGELLLPSVRRALTEAYGCPVLDVYGTSETKEIAWQCAAGNSHVNADVVHMEVLDEDGAPLAVGEEGQLAVTLLVNRAMPLVRYLPGDRGTLLSGRCPCGVELPLLGVVTGRLADTLELANGDRLSPYAITSALERIPAVRQYQVIQQERTLLHVRAVLADGADADASRRSIERALHAAVPGQPTVGVEFVARFSRGERLKFRVVQPLSAAKFSLGGPLNESAFPSGTHPE